MKEDKNNL